MADILPDELLLVTFSLISTADRVTCLRVCRQWRRVALDRTLWRGVPLEECHAPPRALPPGWVTAAQAMIIASAYHGFTLPGVPAAEGGASLRISVMLDAREDVFDWEAAANIAAPLSDEALAINAHRRKRRARKLDSWPEARASFGAIVEQCAMAVALGDEAMNIYLDVLTGATGSSLRALSATVTGVWFGGALTQLRELRFLLLAGRIDWETSSMLLSLPQPELSLRCFTSHDTQPLRLDGFRSSTLTSVELYGFTLPTEGGYFSPARFPRLQRLAVRGYTVSKLPALQYVDYSHRFSSERHLFGDKQKKKGLPTLEELTVECNGTELNVIRYIYPSLRVLTLYDVNGGSVTARFDNPRKQFPSLEVIHTSWPGTYLARDPQDWFWWWDSLLDTRTGPVCLREIRTFSLPPEMVRGVTDRYDHSKTHFRDLELPTRSEEEGEEASITHAMPAGWSLTIAVRGDAIHYHGVRTIAATP